MTTGTVEATEGGTILDIAIGLPTRPRPGAPDHVLDWARAADAGPFSSLAAGDRVVAPAHEALAMLAACAGVTTRIRLMASLVVGPARETSLLARQAATIDAISGGRLVLGLGVGARADDYDATGVPFAGRGARATAQLATLRRLWRGEALDDRTGPIGVAPARDGGPEVLIGGYVDAIAARIAAYGDGFMAPGGGDPVAIAALWRTIRAAWSDAGRPGSPRFVGSSYYALGPNAEGAARAYIDAYYGYDPALAARRLATLPTTPEAVDATIRRVAELGCDELILRPVEADPAMIDHLAAVVRGG